MRQRECGTDAARRKVVLGLGALVAAGPVRAGGGGGGGQEEGGSTVEIGDSGSRRDYSELSLKTYYKLSRNEIKRMIEKVESGKKAYQIGEFSASSSYLLLKATLSDSHGARNLVRAMDGLTKREHRKKFLRDELQRQNRKVQELQKTTEKLRKDRNAAYYGRDKDSSGKRKFDAAEAAYQEELARLKRAEYFRDFVKRWARNPMEGVRD